MAGVQFDALPYEGRKWQLLEGDLIGAPTPTPQHQCIAGNLYFSYREYFCNSPVTAALLDSEFALGKNIRVRPDICILLNERWSGLNLNQTPIQGVPDIVVEVISPSERAADSTCKV